MLKYRGFTLVELIVAVAVIAIISAIAIPNFMSMLNSSRLRGDVNEVVAALNYARAEAIKCRGEVIFSIQNNPWELEVSSDSCAMRGVEGAGSFGVTNNVDVVFNRLGRATTCADGGCQIVINGRTIKVFSSGYIEL